MKTMQEERRAPARGRDQLASTALSGAAGGFIATVPMTAAMELMYRRLPWWERYHLPPSQIVSRLAERAGVREDMSQPEHLAVTLLAHFAYGTTAGAVYGPLASRVPLPTPLTGVVFGLGVWAASYLGLLPALGILRPATQHPPRRTALMIAAHVVWGAALGVMADLMQIRKENREPPRAVMHQAAFAPFSSRRA